MINEMHVSWRAPLAGFAKKLEGDYTLRDLRRLLKKDKDDYHPPRDKIFAAFEATPFDRVRVVIVGQEPYKTPLKATGLAFSMPRDIRPLSSSIKKIYEAIEYNKTIENGNVDGTKPDHGNLDNWANEGVLLLNRVLTFRRCNRCKFNIHNHQGWEVFIEAVIKALSNDKTRQLYFMLWGKEAQNLEKHIDDSHHKVFSNVRHPAAPHSRTGANFETCTHFSDVNVILRERQIEIARAGEIREGVNYEPINWFPPE